MGQEAVSQPQPQPTFAPPISVADLDFAPRADPAEQKALFLGSGQFGEPMVLLFGFW